MKRLMGSLSGCALAMMPAAAWAEGAGGGYRGIASIYFTLITAILIYGVYDAFGKKVMYVAAPLIVIGMYMLLPKT
ncbi:MAG: hypothetical protein EPO64_11115 [Nitrospirae bacterium]|nr:MAG: hypothetical protein EPO64_11115 [Nitrospirota bacterium]